METKEEVKEVKEEVKEVKEEREKRYYLVITDEVLMSKLKAVKSICDVSGIEFGETLAKAGLKEFMKTKEYQDKIQMLKAL